jgi:hypothetical protein
MSKKNVVRLHPSTAVYLFEKICNYMVGKKIDRDNSKEIVGKVTIKPPKKNHPSELGKITFIIKSSSPEEDQRA